MEPLRNLSRHNPRGESAQVSLRSHLRACCSNRIIKKTHKCAFFDRTLFSAQPYVTIWATRLNIPTKEANFVSSRAPRHGKRHWRPKNAIAPPSLLADHPRCGNAQPPPTGRRLAPYRGNWAPPPKNWLPSPPTSQKTEPFPKK